MAEEQRAAHVVIPKESDRFDHCFASNPSVGKDCEKYEDEAKSCDVATLEKLLELLGYMRRLWQGFPSSVVTSTSE